MSQFVILGFKTEYGINRAIDWVHIAPAGEAHDKTRTWHRIADIRYAPAPGENLAEAGMARQALASRWAQIEPAYEAWRRAEELPVNGTPLAAWSGVSPDQAAHLKRMGIATVEAVRDMSESAIPRLPWPNARQLPQLARDFLSSRSATEKDAELAEMRTRLAAMESVLNSDDGDDDATAPKPARRGRPRKAAAVVVDDDATNEDAHE